MEQSVTLESFKNSLTRFVGTNNSAIRKQYLLYYLRRNWSEVIGKFSNHCWPATISEGRLIVGVDNAPLANQLFMVKTELIKKVNQIFKGKYILRDMTFKSGLKIEEFNFEEYKIITQIGQGTFGKIYLVQNKNGEPFSMKKLLLSEELDVKSVINEYQMCYKLKHDNIIKILVILMLCRVKNQ